MSLRILSLLLILGFSSPLSAGEDVRPFVAGSLAKITGARQGKPFVIAFWSVACTHCPRELKALGELHKTHPRLDIVLVAADTPDETPLAAELAGKYGLGRVEQWIFADETPERLRYEIDPRWHGELPRTHFYDRAQRLTTVAGVVSREQLAAWVKSNGTASVR